MNKKLATTLLSTAMVVSVTVPTAVRANDMLDAENIVEQSQEKENNETLENIENIDQETNQEKNTLENQEKNTLENQEDTNETEEVAAQAIEQPEVETQSVEKAIGTTIYVDGYTSGNGNDSNSGTSKDQPVKTLKHAVELAGENGTVIVLDTVIINEDTVLDNNVTIKRGGTCASGMISTYDHDLTINHATIDGNKQEYPRSSQLISINGYSKININEGAKLCNNGDVAIQQLQSNGRNAPIVTMNGGEICDNDCTNNYYKAAIIMFQSVGELYINGGSIHDNKGGAIDVGVPTFKMTGGKIYNNDNSGERYGAIWLTLAATKGFISGGEIYGNKSYNGGAISMAGSTELTISGNTSIHDNTVTGDGSAIYMSYKSSLKIEDGVQIIGNKGVGDDSGGAIGLSESASLTIGKATISNNSAQYGGGIASYTSGTVTLNGTILTNNTALLTSNNWGNGGAISINKTGTLNINDATIENNQALRGGGIAAYDTAVININGNTSIKNNQAPKDGGGGIASYGSSTFNLNSATISENKASYGSGIAAWNNGKVIMKKDVSVIQNTVTSTNPNSSGGAVYVSGYGNGGGQFVMEDGLIKDNTTTGGIHCAGIYVEGYRDTGLVQIKGGSITNNINENGIDQSFEIMSSGYQNTNGKDIVGKLELSGSPTITGQVLLRKNTSEDIKVDVVDTFTPTQPLAIALSNDDWTNHSVIATYASNVTPNKEMFKPYKADANRFIIQNKQDLECMNKVKVTFKNDDGSSNKEVYVMPNGKVDESNAPTLTKTDYIFKYWKNEKDGKEWDFTQDEVAEEDLVLVPEWKKDTTVDYFTVKYVTNSSASIADNKVKDGGKAIEPQISKKGSSIEGWYTTKEFKEGTKWNFDNPVKSGMTLYAKWELNKPTGTLEAEGNITTVHIGKTVKLIATANHESTGDITYSYQWYKDGKKLDSKTRAATGTNEIEVSETGSYIVKITASDGTYTSKAVELGPVEVKITDHAYTGDYKYDENKHWKECDECQNHDHEDHHTYGKWTVVKEATKDEKGLEEKECSVCGYKQTREISYNEPIDPGNNTAPTIDAKDLEITVGDTFDAMKYVTAIDEEDDDLTHKIQIVKNTVDTSKAGTYEITYQVTDSAGTTATKTIKVTVKEKSDIKEEATAPKEDKQEEVVNKSNTVTSNKNVKTGDQTNIYIYLFTSVVAIFIGLFILIKNSKRK